MTEIATFAAGCFWGVEQAFREIPGVRKTQVGYTGGQAENPTYEAICRKDTGHAEAVQVTFDAGVVSYHDLLQAFWEMHDPTQINRQGPDVGDQYRSAIYTHSDGQSATANRSKEVLEKTGKFTAPVATTIETVGKWWPAEEYHQQYIEKRGGGACPTIARK